MVTSLVSTFASLGTASGQCYYTYQEIPHPPGNPPQYTAGRALNNLGHVAGRYTTGGDTSRAFFWSPETGTYLLPFPPGINDMEAFGINDLDQVCGYMATSSPPYRNYGFIWDRETGEYTTIEAPTWATRIEAEDINNAGVVVGTLFSSREVRAFRWQNGVFYDLAADLGVVSSHAYDVNERGEIVGEGGSGADQYGYLSSSQGITWLPRPAEFSSCEAEALNHTGFSVGLGAIGFPGDPQYAGRGLIWLPNGIQIILAPPLGNRDVLMEGINDAGRAVGITSRRLFGGPLTYAFVWQSDTLTDLNALTVDAPRQLADAHAINAAGQILVTRGVLTSVWLPGDLTGDCHVSIDDLVLVLTNFGLPRGSFPRGDVNLDGEVGLADLAVVFAHWGE